MSKAHLDVRDEDEIDLDGPSADAGGNPPPSSSSGPPQRLGNFTAHANVTDTFYVADLDAVIVTTSAKEFGVSLWLKRSSGDFWPSVKQELPAGAICLDYEAQSRTLIVGLSNGAIMQWTASADFNSLSLVRSLGAHQGGVNQILYYSPEKWVISASADKSVRIHNLDTGSLIASHACNAIVSCVQFDADERILFAGDFSGWVHVLKFESGGFRVLNRLEGHDGSIRVLEWCAKTKLLFSGSYDRSITAWDVGGRQGKSVQLNGHDGKVKGLIFLPSVRKLISGGDDGLMVIWDMNADRDEVPEWRESDVCEVENCKLPFIFALSAMWEAKRMGVRQHHCRLTGKAICDECCVKMYLPKLGYEQPVRVCKDDVGDLTEDDRKARAEKFNMKTKLATWRLDREQGYLSMCSPNSKVVSLWNLRPVWGGASVKVPENDEGRSAAASTGYDDRPSKLAGNPLLDDANEDADIYGY